MEKDFCNRLKVLFIIFICLTIGALIGCGNEDTIDKDTNNGEEITGKLVAFTSNEELEAYLKDQYEKGLYTDYSYALTERTSTNGGGEIAAGDAASGESPYFSPSANDTNGYTGTNLQEAGVDESDVVKTDGEYLYIARNDTVIVVDTSDPMEVVSTMKVNGTVDSIYLYNPDADTKLLALLYAPFNNEGISWLDSGEIDTATIRLAYWIPVQAKTGIAFYDINDSSVPEEIKTIEADGYLVSSRRIENRLHIVQQYLPDLPDPYLLENQIDGMTLNDLIPLYSDISGTVDPQSAPLVAYNDCYHPSIDGGASMVTIMTFDLDNTGSPFSSVGIVADASIVYASTQALYCSSTYWNGLETGADDPVEQTMIYKFDLTGEEVAAQDYISVNGRALNQFSLGEYEGVLRIATTTGWSWSVDSASENHLYCIKYQNNGLEIIGRLEDLATGEELYSARFIGPRGYLVTFLNTDPLFTLDLSDPTAPQVIGELKVNGYSSYIHPWGDNYLVTVGKDAEIDNDGFAWYQGVQLSIFDISDFSDPQLLHRVVLGDRGTGSEALYNHKAFTFWESEDLLAVPIDLYEHQSTPTEPYAYGDFTFKGLYIYLVGIEDGFQEIGKISTSSDPDEYWYYNGWTRGIFIDEDVYAVTPEVVKSARIDDIEGTVQSLTIESDDDF